MDAWLKKQPEYVLYTPIDERREDAKIVDDNGDPLVLLEFKGISKGIKRKDVGQVNFHRDRNDLDMKVPGALIINSDSSISLTILALKFPYFGDRTFHT